MPRIGLGTWPMDDAQAEVLVAQAIRDGYRLIDTAENYGNETGVGRGIRAGGVDRDQIFVTSKFNARWHGFEEVQQAFANSAERLGLDRIDMLLIHWPLPQQDRYVDAWRGILHLYEQGKVSVLGVSNFKPAHIDRLIEVTGVAPQVNQVQLNPYIGRAAERRYHAEHGIVTETWQPLGLGGKLLEEAVVLEAARRHSKSPAQVVLRWQVQQGLVPIPRTQNPARIPQNIAVFDFELDASEMAAITALDRNGAGAADSDRIGH
ncbi:MAG TPA: aldo/keto reductase [Dehalococcoidia bacterium]|nr:aldo/keto reductase [Dehalococcoidia bacterium]